MFGWGPIVSILAPSNSASCLRRTESRFTEVRSGKATLVQMVLGINLMLLLYIHTCSLKVSV